MGERESPSLNPSCDNHPLSSSIRGLWAIDVREMLMLRTIERPAQ